MQEIRLDTARGPLAALRGGRSAGPKLLCLHGWLDNAASFVPLAPFLEDFDWVALDLPGHGASSHRAPGYDYAFADWLHDVLDALDVLDWPQANLLGHSMGGAIACVLAAAVPARVQRLALVEALGPVAGDPAQAGQRLRDAVAARRDKPARPPRTLPDVDTAVAARLLATRMSPAAARLIVERNLRPVPGGFAWRSDPRLTWPGHVRMDEATIQSMLRAIEAPVRVVAADPPPSFFTAPVRAARLACLREGSVVELAGSHHLHMEQPADVAAALVDFLRG
jgi:pimeloyl-ACP methyl ester carboxylesterase